jgi:ArsR family transcriptional regulator
MPKQLQEMETLFKALADATRLRILGLLLTGEVCVCHIYESLKIPQPKASRHLAYLRRSGLVETRREGLWIHYRLGRLADPVMAAIVDAVRHALTHTDTVHRDAERLRKKTGCCLPAPGEVTHAVCCSPQAETLNLLP